MRAPVESPESCCAVRDVLDRVGDKWSALVIASLGPGTLRFGELRRCVDGISQRMLTVTLRNLERDGLVTRQAFAESPPRVEYSLTTLGESLLGTIQDLVDWSRRHARDIEASRDSFDRTAATSLHLSAAGTAAAGTR